MTLDFTKCDDCGKIFPAADPNETLCPACKGEEIQLTEKDMLRSLKNTLRDVQARGEFLNIPQLAEESEVEEGIIWHFIKTGEISTASVDDPAVKDFLVRKKREMAKQSQKSTEKKEKKKDVQQFHSKKKSLGFHLSNKDVHRK